MDLINLDMRISDHLVIKFNLLIQFNKTNYQIKEKIYIKEI